VLTGSRPSYLHVCRILIFMAEAFFHLCGGSDNNRTVVLIYAAGHVPVEPDPVRRTDTDGAKVCLATELRYRENIMATTWSSRQDARTRYAPPAVADGRSTSVTEIDLYRNLEETLGPV